MSEREIEELRAENRRLRETLRFYAEPEFYTVSMDAYSITETDIDIVNGVARSGKRARAALARRRIP